MGHWEFRMNSRLLPQCAHFGNYTEQYIECHLRHITLAGGSPVGTCRIGAANDSASVVDPQLRYIDLILFFDCVKVIHLYVKVCGHKMAGVC
jgi:hypothetical protein